MSDERNRVNFTEAVQAYLEENDLLLKTETTSNDRTRFTVRIPGSPGPAVIFTATVDDTGFFTLFSYVVFDLKDEKELEGMVLADSINARYRFLKCFVDRDGDFRVGYEMFLADDKEALEEQLSKTFLLFINIFSEAFPKIMSLIVEDPDD